MGILEKVPHSEPTKRCHRMAITRKHHGTPYCTVDLSPLNKFCKRETFASETSFHLSHRIPGRTWKTVTEAFNLGLHVLSDTDKEDVVVSCSFLVAPLPQMLLIQVLHFPTNYSAKTILFITQHHLIQDFAKKMLGWTKRKHVFVCQILCSIQHSSSWNKLLSVKFISWKTSRGKVLAAKRFMQFYKNK